MLPLHLALGDGNEVGAEEHAAHALDIEQPRGQRRGQRLVLVGEVGRSLGEHGLAGNELERGGIGRRLGLDEHRLASPSRSWRTALAGAGHAANFRTPLR